MKTLTALIVILIVFTPMRTYSQGESGLKISQYIDIFRVQELDGDFLTKKFYQSKSFADLSTSWISIGWFWKKDPIRSHEVFASFSSHAPIPYTYYERSDVPPSFNFAYVSLGYQLNHIITKTENHQTELGIRNSFYHFYYSDLSEESGLIGWYGDVIQFSDGYLFSIALCHSYHVKRFVFSITPIFRVLDINYTKQIDNNIGRYFKYNIDNTLSEGFVFRLLPPAITISLGVAYKFKTD